MRVLEKVKPIKETHVEISKRYTLWVSFLEKQNNINHLVENKSVHSLTVLPITATPALLTKIKASAKKKGFLLGEGYGDLKATSFRIANFPALKNSEVKSLMRFLKITLH
jgi:phosphoserine aminotransferase